MPLKTRREASLAASKAKQAPKTTTKKRQKNRVLVVISDYLQSGLSLERKGGRVSELTEARP
jgi:hypothetical protein